jgi:polyhydroxyalkanoate synthesis regulator phasin
MSHYEIDLLTKGSLSQDESNSLIKELIEPLKSCKDFKEDK